MIVLGYIIKEVIMQIDNEEVKLVLSKNIKLARNMLGLTQETFVRESWNFIKLF